MPQASHQHFFLAALLFPAMLAWSQRTPTEQAGPERVQIWSQKCVDPQHLGVTVRFHTKVLYQGTLPICKGRRDEEEGKLHFRISAGYPLRSASHTHVPVEGDIWQASGDPDALILGIALMGPRKIWVNSLHVAKVDQIATSEIDEGLFISTYPLAR